MAVVGGLFGQNVFVTSTSGAFVLRGAPHMGSPGGWLVTCATGSGRPKPLWDPDVTLREWVELSIVEGGALIAAECDARIRRGERGER